MGEFVEFGTSNDSTRENWIRGQLSRIPEGLTILDAGAGDQHHRKDCSHLKYTSQDFAQYNGNNYDVGLQVKDYNYGKLDIISDIISIPREDKSFDVILCSEVLEHIPHPELAIKELSRLLKDGGKLILTAPFCSLTHFAPYHFLTGFNSFWYRKILPEHSLGIRDMQTYGNYFEYLAQEIYRLWTVANQYCQYPTINEEEIRFLKGTVEYLYKCHQTSKNSWQLLNFGYLVIAEKE